MTCDEFEAIGLDAERDASLTDAQRAAAAAHAASCSRCAALRNSWEATRLELCSLAQATSLDTPARVEMHLLQQFRTQYHTPKVRRTAVAAAWALAAAAVLVGAASWVKWRSNRGDVALSPSRPSPVANNTFANSGAEPSTQQSPKRNAGTDLQSLVTDNELSDFTLLPGVLPGDTDDAAILRVRMQRGALGTLGLTVNEDRAGEWIQVDLLVGNDGLPQAVRLPE